jgi:hypothetical protein
MYSRENALDDMKFLLESAKEWLYLCDLPGRFDPTKSVETVYMGTGAELGEFDSYAVSRRLANIGSVFRHFLATDPGSDLATLSTPRQAIASDDSNESLESTTHAKALGLHTLIDA